MAAGAGSVMDAAARVSRRAQPGLAVVLCLSALHPPGGRPHHRRVARALFDATAAQHGGEVLALDGGDLALVCRTAAGQGPGIGGLAAEPAALPGLLARLLSAEAQADAPVVHTWHLPQDAPALETFLRDRPPPPSFLPPPAAPPGRAGIDQLLLRQTAVLVGRGSTTAALRPLFREVSFALDTVTAVDPAWRQAAGDPCAIRALLPALDLRLLALLHRALGAGGPLDAAAAPAPPLHVNLTPAAIGSAAFDRFAAAGRVAGTPLAVGIEVSLNEAMVDPAGFARACARVHAAGFALVLDEVPMEALLLADLRHLVAGPGFALAKLVWLPRVADLPAADAALLDAELARLRPERVVLCQAEGEAAMRWGLARRIRRFQGPYVEAALAGARVNACAYAGACTLRQCLERASATSPAGRALCQDTALLDAGSPALLAPKTIAA